MSCIFCDSLNHLTQNCDKFETDESRNRRLFIINTCEICKSSWSKYFTYCIQCEPVTKCFTCFSRQHHTFFCPIRSNPPKVFRPNIDQNLIKRFFGMCNDPLEQYSLVISNPEASNLFELKPVEVFKEINLLDEYFFQSFPKSAIVVIDGEVKIEKSSNDDKNDIVFGPNLDIYSNFIECKKKMYIMTKIVKLKHIILKAEDFFYLLSPISEILNFSHVLITPPVTLSQILMKSSIVKEISIYNSNIQIPDTWVEDLEMYGKKVIKLIMKVKNLNFNTKILADLIKSKKMKIIIVCESSFLSSAHLKKFSNHFSSPSYNFPATNYFLQIRNEWHGHYYYLKPL